MDVSVNISSLDKSNYNTEICISGSGITRELVLEDSEIDD